MKILLVNDYGTPAGGAEIGAFILRDELRQRGHTVRLFTSSARPGPGPLLADDVCFGTTSRLRTPLQLANPWAAARLRRVLAGFQPDVVHVKMFLTQLSPLILPALRRVPSLYHVVWYRPICPVGTKLLPNGQACHSPPGAVCYHSGCLPLHHWLLLIPQLKLWRRWRSVFQLIVANSTAVKRRLEAEGLGPLEVAWNGVPRRPMRPPLPAAPLAVFTGRLAPEKGADVLLRAFAHAHRQIPAARLVVMGDGSERGRLETLAAELGLSTAVTFTGQLPSAEVERRSDAAWVQVVPSLTEEPFGLVAAEAQMRGTAVIASRHGGLVDIVRDGETGRLVTPGDAAALGGALTALLQDRAEAEALGAAGRQVALQLFTAEAYADRFLALYQKAIALGRPA
jgi:glycosyltransferase involved in cell wall biosynthesis